MNSENFFKAFGAAVPFIVFWVVGIIKFKKFRKMKKDELPCKSCVWGIITFALFFFSALTGAFILSLIQYQILSGEIVGNILGVLKHLGVIFFITSSFICIKALFDIKRKPHNQRGRRSIISILVFYGVIFIIGLLTLVGSKKETSSIVNGDKKSKHGQKGNLGVKQKVQEYYRAGQAAFNQHQYSRSVDDYKKALEMGIKLFGPEHKNVGSIHNNLGLAYVYLGQVEKGILYYMKSLKILKKNVGPKDPTLLNSYRNVARAYIDIQKWTESTQYLDKMLSILNDKSGGNESDLIFIYGSLGRCYLQLKYNQKAVEYFELGLDLQRQTLGNNHPDLAITMNNLGEIARKAGKCREAINYALNVLKIDSDYYGSDHPELILDYNNLGLAYLCQGEKQKAYDNFIKALKINGPQRTQMYAVICLHLGIIMHDLGKYSEAIKYLEESSVLLEKFLGNTDPNTILAQKKLVDAKKHSQQSPK